ncbi:TldD/PmbA family protein [Ruminococcus flavefaciens]|uniref:TldD/PmbA family protein n=1 Tax=Ruminococcus flavefaciens TaxID=1265 RepID=UPI0004917AAD|nr:metallopeptidase TldD-related protein [Ruminococcus flavefaciens]
MVKEERKKVTVINLVNGQKNITSFFEDGTVRRCINNNDVEYYADNSIDSSIFTMDADDYIDDIQWHDIDALIKEHSLGTVLCTSVVIRSERRMLHVTADDNITKDDTLYTIIELTLSFGNLYSPITSKRNLYVNGKLNRKNILDTLNKELFKIEKQYSEHTSSELISVDPEEYEIILPAGIGGIFVHEAIGHCLEGDLFFEKDNVLNKKLGKRITLNDISISDRCSREDMIYYNISDDGIIPENVDLIKNGFLEGIMTNSMISEYYKIKDTGNGRAMDCFNIPIPRMRNTYLHNGSESCESILRNTKKGIIAADIIGGNVITANGDFVFNVNHGLIVENGSIIGVTKPFLFSSNIADALNQINAIGNDLEFYPSKCAKQGQLIDVSFGMPTVKIAKRGICL